MSSLRTVNRLWPSRSASNQTAEPGTSANHSNAAECERRQRERLELVDDPTQLGTVGAGLDLLLGRCGGRLQYEAGKAIMSGNYYGEDFLKVPPDHGF